MAALEKIAQEKLAPLVDRYEIVGDVRIQGLFIGLEFVKDKASKEPALEIAHQIHFGCLRRGLVLIHEEGLWWIRLLPALNMPAEMFRTACDIIEESIQEMGRERGFDES